MTTFVAVYHGQTVGTAKLVALSADPALVEQFVTKILPTDWANSPCEDAESQSDKGDS